LFDYKTIAARSERDVDQPLAFVESLAEERDSPGAELREAYLSSSFGPIDINIGKQFIFWGVLTGIRVVDEINPMDFREFITPELLDYRIPLWSAKFDYYGNYVNSQFIFIPDLQFHKPAPRGSEWELFQEVPGTQYPKTFTPRNSEIGFRLSSKIAETDLALSYFYTWDDFPVLYRRVQITQTSQIVEPEFRPRYERMHMYGLTFQREISGQILKGEAAFVRGKYFGLTPVDQNGDGFLDNDGVLQKKHLRLGLGLDFNLFKTEVSPSVTEWIIFNYDPAILQKKYDTTLNLFLRKTFSERSAFFEMLGIAIVNFKELYVRPKFGFFPATKFQITVGADLFYGKKSQLGVIAINGRPTDLATVTQSVHFFGNFHDNNRAFFEMKYNF
jgi:hypothetical protein